MEQPAFRQVRVSNELRKRGIFVSPSDVRSVWLRHNLASFKKHLLALESHVAQTSDVLTDAQVQALERFHKTILQEFYQVAFRRKVCSSVEELQVDLDSWLAY